MRINLSLKNFIRGILYSWDINSRLRRGYKVYNEAAVGALY